MSRNISKSAIAPLLTSNLFLCVIISGTFTENWNPGANFEEESTEYETSGEEDSEAYEEDLATEETATEDPTEDLATEEDYYYE